MGVKREMRADKALPAPLQAQKQKFGEQLGVLPQSPQAPGQGPCWCFTPTAPPEHHCQVPGFTLRDVPPPFPPGEQGEAVEIRRAGKDIAGPPRERLEGAGGRQGG